MSLMDLLRPGGNRRDEYEDFVNRYEDGDPSEGYDADEARSRYDEVAGELSDDDYELSAREAFERLSPQQRRELGRMLRQEGRSRSLDLGEQDYDDDDRYDDPSELARMSRKMRKQQAGGLGALLGGGGGGGLGGLLGNPVAKAALAGVAAMAAKRMFSR
jgi:hypothetical protein